MVGHDSRRSKLGCCRSVPRDAGACLCEWRLAADLPEAMLEPRRHLAGVPPLSADGRPPPEELLRCLLRAPAPLLPRVPSLMTSCVQCSTLTAEADQ